MNFFPKINSKLKKCRKKSKKFFTLIELLIVIAIIAIIAAVVFVALNPLQRFASARDTMRLSQVTQIKKALELYITDNGIYPSSTQWSSGKIVSPNGVAYLATIPNAPTPPDGSCSSSSNAYVYTPGTTTNTYSLSFCLGSQVDKFAAGNNILTPKGIVAVTSSVPASVCLQSQVVVTSTLNHVCNTGAPDYDTCTYDTVSIGTQCWIKQNLNVGHYVVGVTTGAVSQTNNGVMEKYCYGDSTSSCQTYGGLYQYDEAAQYAGAKDICPNGWHLPLDSDFSVLENYLKDNGQTCVANRSYDDCVSAGTKLKTGGSSGFDGILAGYYYCPDEGNNLYFAFNNVGEWWSSAGYTRSLSGVAGIWRDTPSTCNGFSVRCIQN
ncbi:MAG: FISUMP domain-containing protein [Candidatus Falkowbacteria bacterium]